MNAPVSTLLDPLDLAALLCSRLCHDLISPVGAIVNGMEVLEETNDESTKTFALDLIKKSAEHASAKLQFCRIAFGAAGSAGSEIDTGDAESVSRGFLEDEKIKLEWKLPRQLLPKNQVKLLLNLLLLAGQFIPRGGVITVEPSESGTQGLRIVVAGQNPRVGQHLAALVTGEVTSSIDAHAIQPFYAGLLARACGLKIRIDHQGEQVLVTAA
jgi:histidine phosphotransferase ChpT